LKRPYEKKEERFPFCEKIRKIEKIDARENCSFFWITNIIKKVVLKD
jgi:hypothetical protein